MAAAEGVQFSLKVMMIKESNKVLYAEVDSDFADVLLSFLTLPLGTIVRLLIKHYGNFAPILGSLNSLYAGLQNMDDSHFWTEEGKLMLLNPRNSSEIECSKLKIQIDDTPPTQYFVCSNSRCASLYYSVKCICPKLSNPLTSYKKDVEVEADCGDKGVFAEQTASFILTDDFQLLTNSPASILRILRLNGIKDTNVVEERTLAVGLKEIMELLKGSLVSMTPITDIVFSMSSAREKTKRFCARAKNESDFSWQARSTDQNIVSVCKKITVTVFVQKSSNRVLLAQTRHDFIDFIFSLLTIPLGRVLFLLGCNSCLGSIYNLYGSILNLKNSDYMKSREKSTKLLEPQIPTHFLSSYQIFPLDQQITLFQRHRSVGIEYKYFVSPTTTIGCCMRLIDPKGHDSFVKGPTLFIVTEDLVVYAAASTSIISTLNKMKIPVSDVEEHDLVIGMEEALSILKASLTSTCALSEGLKPFLKSRSKQEL
ncbi:uncharacterized protein [Henckelia pumila]|uniref:uncharacterized protein n=1 Tax=Henckelia pumila TaxID=405737 RepID=UPI003C6DF6C4